MKIGARCRRTARWRAMRCCVVGVAAWFVWWPQVYLGAQYVAPVRAPVLRDGVAVSALALWPLRKGWAAQAQYIQPLQRDRAWPLVRVAVDVRVF